MDGRIGQLHHSVERLYRAGLLLDAFRGMVPGSFPVVIGEGFNLRQDRVLDGVIDIVVVGMTTHGHDGEEQEYRY